MSTAIEALRVILKHMFLQAIKAVDPVGLMRAHVKLNGELIQIGSLSIDPDRCGRIVVIGTGKASAAMAAGLEAALEALGDKGKLLLSKLTGVINVPDGITAQCSKIEIVNVRPQGSNAPTDRVLAATQRQIETICTLGPDDLLIDLISGGGSATRELLCDGLSLEDLDFVRNALQANGMGIVQLNAIRKHCSRVKGGIMSQWTKAGSVLALILSDVVGDPLESIASGPWAGNTFSPQDALEILQGAGIISGRVYQYILNLKRSPWQKVVPDRRVRHEIIGRNEVALNALRDQLTSYCGYQAVLSGSDNEGSALDVGAALYLDSLLDEPGTVFLYGGETKVTVNRSCDGSGGRCQTMVLSALKEAWENGLGDMVIFAFGTDGEDGPTDAAGAMIDQEILLEAKAKGVTLADVEQALRDSNEYPLLSKIGALIKTGQTGTNVYDIWGILHVKPAGI